MRVRMSGRLVIAGALAIGTLQALWLLVLGHAAAQGQNAAHTWATMQPSTLPASAPLRKERGVLLLEATLNGVGPMLFALDPGGDDVYTVYARTRLKNRIPDTLCVSRACIGVTMKLFDGQPSDLDPQHDPGLGVLAGSLGPLLLRHYVVRIDYRASTLTLIPPEQFHPASGERPLAMTFDSYGMPVARGLLDGISAPFELDVRAETSMLFAPFLDREGLRRKYRDAPVVRRSGGLVAYEVHHVQIDGVDLVNVPFWFSNSSAPET